MTSSEISTLFGPTFGEWAEPWTRLGLCLNLWDPAPETVETAPAGSPFWNALLRHSRPFASQLRDRAARAAAEDGGILPLQPDCGIAVIAMPLVHRKRAVGAVTACALTESFRDAENLARFCSVFELDAALIARLAADVAVLPMEAVRAHADILGRLLQTSTDQQVAHNHVTELSEHLAQAYEELNLLYRVSSSLSTLRQPTAHVEQLCADLVGAMPVRNVAAFLEIPGARSSGPIVFTSGSCPIGQRDLLRLYREALATRSNADGALVVNDVRRSQLAWAAADLAQLIFVPLQKKKHVFGGLLAMNHAAGRDFGSEELQLLSAIAERSSAFLENVRLYANLEQLFMGLMHALVSSIDAKDPYTCGHSQRVAWLSRHVGHLAGIHGPAAERVYLSGLLHDIGKIGISEAVLRKNGRLTPTEFEEMRKHPVIGARILEGVRQIDDVIPGILYHHERIDGRGYPEGLRGEEIPLLGRIVGLADSFDAMTTSRTYRDARPIAVAVEEIRRCSGSQFDPGLAELLVREDLEEVRKQMCRSVYQPLTQSLSPRLPGNGGET